MSSLFLSAEELRELTGYLRPADQRAWLREAGYPHDIGADGRARVLRSYLQARLGRMIESEHPSEPKLRLQ